MFKTINIATNKAIDDLYHLKSKLYDYDVKIINVHLKELNEIIGLNMFTKNDLYVEAGTLWDSMQPNGGNRKHHFHDLTPEDIVEALRNITRPYCVLRNNKGRIEILSSINSHLGVPVIVAIELNSKLGNDYEANINKMVTIFPKRDMEAYIKKFSVYSIYYLSKGNLK